MSTNLCKGHSVGMFPDLSQPETLLHLSIPTGKARAAFCYATYIYIEYKHEFISANHILFLSPHSDQTQQPHV